MKSINIQNTKSSGQITARSFLDHYAIPHDKAQAYPVAWDEQAEEVVVQV
ncbi:MAG: hypothetical protein KJ626_00790 [Verrucomicrobia bacterium]|nr:hypothetical protein [Verrucomicrobiota bacterium]